MIAALVDLVSPIALFNIVWATFLGIVIGGLPGLTATMGLALLVTLTYGFESDQAILVLLCVYLGAIYGGSRSAILLRIPGTPASAATTLDGYPIVQAGRGGEALGLATTASCLGTLIGMICLVLIAPLLATFALDFGSNEYLWLGLFGILICGTMSSFGSPLKGWISGFLGLLIAMVGQENMIAYVRYDFGVADLAGGIALIPAMVGLFGMSEVLLTLSRRPQLMPRATIERVLPRFGTVWKNRMNILRSGVLGSAIGIIPGVGEDIGSWVSYAVAKRFSRDPNRFGRGSTEGLIAAETGNNSAMPGAIIPALTLGVPGSAPAAILLTAMFIHGVRPGPFIMIENPMFVYKVFWILGLATVCILVLGLLITRPLLHLLYIPSTRLMPIIFILCVIGPYALSQRLFDVYVMAAFGILGFVMRKLNYPTAPLILGIILGPIIDANLRRSLSLVRDSYFELVASPISAVLAAITFATLLGGAVGPFKRWIGRVLKI